MRRILIPLLILLLLALPVPARAGSGGSIYSLIGIGDLRMAPNVRAAGMGYTGYALHSPYYVNTLSPATWAKIDRTRIEASLSYEGFRSTNGLNSRYLARADFGGAMLAIPVSPANGIVVGAGFTPYSKVDYNTYAADTFTSAPDTMAYSINHIGRGGVSRGQLGISYTPSRSLALGVGLNYLFGTLERSSTLTPRLTTFAGSTQTEEITMNGTTFTISAVLDSMETIAPALAPFSIGISLTTRAALTTTQRYTYTFVDQRDTSQENTDHLVVPAAIGVGISYRPSDRLVIAADFTSQPWAQSEYRGRTPDGLRNSMMLGIGIERLPARDAGKSLLDRVAYRLGFLYDELYYKPSGQAINAWAVTAGLGLPLSADTRLNLAVEYGSRGTVSNNLIKDTIIRFSAALTISEPWFVRYEED